MDGSSAEPSEELRSRFRLWLKDNLPQKPSFKLPQSFLEVESKQQFEYLLDWQKRLYDAGFLGFDTPKEYGGQGVDKASQRVIAQELARHRAPFMVNYLGLNWVGPTIQVHGTEEQKKKYLPPLLRGDEIWCQGFSEPGAGSDLASLSTKAEKQPDGSWRVNGHKVWTTLGHFARWMILLARTDPTVNKYAGLSFFLFPMDVDGVSIQPLVKMTGEGGFNQVVLDDAPMPADALLGSEGQGWPVAMTTLTFERGAAEDAGRERAAGYLEHLERLFALVRQTQRGGEPALNDPVIRDRLAQLTIETHALALGAQRAEVSGLSSEHPLALQLMTKLVMSEWNQRLTQLACEILGPDANLWMGDAHAPDEAAWPRGYLSSFGMTIGGGTSEVMRNILGERVLGLAKSK